MKWGISLLVVIGLIVELVGNWPSQNLRLVVCDVGQGDAALVIHRNIQVVIDGGPGNNLIACLGDHLPFWDNRIEMVVVSHAQEDHIGGLVELFRRYQVDLLVWNELGVENPKFDEIVKEVERKKTQVLTPAQGDKIRTGELAWKVLWPDVRMDDPKVLGVSEVNKYQTMTQIDREKIEGLKSGDINEQSVVVELEFGGFVGMFTGDIGVGVEEALVQAQVLRPIIYLKVAHHGSKNSSSGKFMEAVKPKVATISSGRGNSYGHPHKQTLELLEAAGVKVLRTDEQGDVILETDGERWWVR